MVRPAKLADVPQIVKLINKNAQKGLLLPRNLNQVYEKIRDFVVAEIDGKVVGCGALQIMWKDLAEIRSLAIDESQRGKGIGSQIVAHLLEDAKRLELEQVFALTYQEEFFKKFGFRVVGKETFPHKIWRDCLNCPKFYSCDETAMLLELTPKSEKEETTEPLQEESQVLVTQ